MMRVTVTTHKVLERLHEWETFRPYNFLLLPILADGGYPANIDPKRFTLVAPFESDQKEWTELQCANIADPSDDRKYNLTTAFTSPEYGHRAVVDSFENLLYRYIRHPEAKSLAPDGGPCRTDTRGLLQRAHILAGKHRRIGKEFDRQWEEGDSFEAVTFEPVEYRGPDSPEVRDDRPIASEKLIRKIKKMGVRKLVRLGLSTCSSFSSVVVIS